MNTIEYNDNEAIRAALVGKKIVDTKVVGELGSYSGEIHFTLDDGSVFIAEEADGGCACSNGCFDLKLAANLPGGVITGVEVVEENDGYDSGVIRLFVYTEGVGTALFTSSGSDNGYYGWGYHLRVVPA